MDEMREWELSNGVAPTSAFPSATSERGETELFLRGGLWLGGGFGLGCFCGRGGFAAEDDVGLGFGGVVGTEFEDEVFVDPEGGGAGGFVRAVGAEFYFLDFEEAHAVDGGETKDVRRVGIEQGFREVGKLDDNALVDEVEEAHARILGPDAKTEKLF